MIEKAQPNAEHLAIASLKRQLEDRFHLITQSLDRLHYRAGNMSTHTYEFHGNLEQMRYGRNCSLEVYSLPTVVTANAIDNPISEAE